MVHELSQYVATLPDVENWLAGDDRVLAFRVVDGAGNGVDISSATVSWELYERPYQSDPADAVLSGGDASVEVVTDNRVNAADGEFEVRLDSAATDGRWGHYTQRPSVEQPDGTTASWIGEVILEA